MPGVGTRRRHRLTGVNRRLVARFAAAASSRARTAVAVSSSRRFSVRPLTSPRPPDGARRATRPSTSDATPDGEERPAGAGPPPPGCTPSSPSSAPSAWRDLDIDWAPPPPDPLRGRGPRRDGARRGRVPARRQVGGGGTHGVPRERRPRQLGRPLAVPDADAACGSCRASRPCASSCPRGTRRNPRIGSRTATRRASIWSSPSAARRRSGDAGTARPSAAAVVDLWEFAQFAEMAEIDGAGAAAVVQRSLALDVVKPRLEEALRGAAVGGARGDAGRLTGCGRTTGGGGAGRAKRPEGEEKRRARRRA